MAQQPSDLKATALKALGSLGTTIPALTGPNNPIADVVKDYEKLKTDRSGWERRWQEIADLMVPRRADFTGRRTSGEERRSKIVDSTAVRNVSRFAAGLHNMLTPAAAPWFILKPAYKPLEEVRDVQLWLEEITRLVQGHFASPKSNFHSSAYEFYTDLGSFGTGNMFVEDVAGVGPFYRSFPLAKTFFATNRRGQIDCVYREYTQTAKGLIEQFPREMIPEKAIKKLEEGKPFEEFECLHVIKPWHAIKMGSPLQLIEKAYISLHIFIPDKAVMEVSGYDEFPFVVSRWCKNEDEIYGRGPGSDALPDVKMLQEMEKTYLKGLQKQVDPPLTLPDDGFLGQIKTYPGAINIHRNGYQQKEVIGMIPMGQPQYADNKMAQIRDSINKTFYLDIMELPGPTAPDGDVYRFTATEVATRQRDRLGIIGPIVARQESEFLSPLIERTYSVMIRAGLLPPPPEIMQEVDLRIEYVNPVSVSQRSIELNSINQLVQYHMPLAQIDPNALKRLNISRITELGAEILNVPPSVIYTNEEMQQIAQAEQEQQQQQQQMEQQQSGAEVDEKRSAASLNDAKAQQAAG
jgi:hypothetical protein